MGFKILFIIHKILYGGAGKNLMFLANKFSEEDNEVYFLTYESNLHIDNLFPQVNQIGISNPANSIFFVKRIVQIKNVRGIINQVKPDVIISFLTYPNIISIIASFGTHIPVIISERCNPYLSKNWFPSFRDFIYIFASGYVFQTYYSKNYFIDRIKSRSTIIPNPIIEAYVPSKWEGEKENTIVNLGRFEIIQKRQDILIKAFSKIVGDYPDINLVLFGDGSDESEIRKIILNCHLENRVILPGVTKNVYESIKKSKLFVLSSDYEGIPNALIEAMSIGLPCISTNYSPGGAMEIIQHLENGMLVETGNIDELAKAMKFMLDHPQEADEMGKKATSICLKLDSETIFNAWQKFTYQIIKLQPVKSNK